MPIGQDDRPPSVAWASWVVPANSRQVVQAMAVVQRDFLFMKCSLVVIEPEQGRRPARKLP
ncbi:hypothetical protein D3C84_1240780 [compost metagenome]